MKIIAEQLKIFLKPTHIINLTVGLMAATWLSPVSAAQTLHKTIDIDGVEIFYREAGPVDAPTILLLHGFPTSSHMFRNLIPALSDQYHVIAPDYPGFGNSAQPLMSDFDYSFDNIALVMEHFISTLEIKNYSLYLMDYGAPIGFRLASKHPEKVDSLIIQNGNAYSEGLRKFWDPIRTYWNDRTTKNSEPLTGFISAEGVKWQYTHGVRNTQTISPDNWNADLRHLTRKGNPSIQLELFYDYQNNVPYYPQWQAYFRKHQPPTLIVWGKNDFIFPTDGAHPYKRDLENLEFHLLDTGHFALEEDGEFIATTIRKFLSKNIVWGKNDSIFPVDGAHPCKRDLKNLEFKLFDTGHFALEEDGEFIATTIRTFLRKNTVAFK